MKKRNLTPKIKLRHKKKVERTIIICSIFAILIALYCLACFQLDNKVIWKNVSANGISLKGMTKKEAGDAKVYNYKSGQKMYEKVYELPWEVEVFEKKYRMGGMGLVVEDMGYTYHTGTEVFKLSLIHI